MLLGLSYPIAAVRAALALAPDAAVLRTRRLHRAHDAPLGHVAMTCPLRRARGCRVATWRRTRMPCSSCCRHASESRSAKRRRPRAPRLPLAIWPRRSTCEGAPVLVCERTTFDHLGRPLVFNVYDFRADRFEVRVSMQPREWKLAWGPPGLATPSAKFPP
jgi:DNA-binding GntR family transcriptional regulator